MTEKSLGWGHLKPVTDAFNRAMAAPEAPAGFAGQFVLTAVKGRYYESWYCRRTAAPRLPGSMPSKAT